MIALQSKDDEEDMENDYFFSVQNLDIENEKYDNHFNYNSLLDSPLSEYSSYGKSYTRRVVAKSGNCNVLKKNCTKPMTMFISDYFTSLIECRWRWITLIFGLSFIITWFFFAFFYWAIAYHHGDLKISKIKDPFNDSMPCITGMDDFISCYMFSMETQYSTGYGSRLPNTVCPEAIFLVSIQSIFGVLINAMMGGIIFVKLAKPKKRTQNLLFSDKAVVCKRDDVFYLIWRIGDIRKHHLVNVTIKAWLLCRRVTKEGEIIPRYKYNLDISVDDGGPETLFQWPLTVCHKINSRSPLYKLSAIDLLSAKFEIITCLNGTMESSGCSLEARTSYLPNEILWGHWFAPLFVKKDEKYYVDYSKFETTISVDTPLISAYEYEQIQLEKQPLH